MNFLQSSPLKYLPPLLAVGLGFSFQAMPGLAVQPSVQAESHLYGQSQKPNQLKQGYVVFEQYGNTVVGASYYPRSEFRCFVGNLDPQSEAVTGVMLASMQRSQTPININLSPLHQLDRLSPNDQRMLATCKQAVVNRQQQLPARWQPIPAALLQ
ncbi:hypothetical protein [Acaryochloris marina]|uniref:Uncharacterized protein n=1 Tax=Acaryochloris marina (strain MBIC 11017) TaxID=329726 RepID=B0C5V6_ACAM1|nr:hypothetical protein [Acaryochloris marina]ABW29968.1 conserved hypothetical protein [Acaryochloris marina MBIC11017]